MPPPLTRIESVIQAVRTRINARADGPGTRLPSVRAQAAAMGVSVSTVVEAYERLAAEGLISARAGSGYVVGQPHRCTGRDGTRLGARWTRCGVSRQSLETPPGHLKPGCGWMPNDWLYHDGVRRGLRRLARTDAMHLVDYAGPLGLPRCASCCRGAAPRSASMYPWSRSC